MMEEKKVEDSNVEKPTAKIPVDRLWISKLLKKHPNPNALVQDKALVVAPMVDQSDLPFRLLCRKYGANLAMTPMIHSRLLVESESYRGRFLGTWPAEDRPLIAQLCGSEPEWVLPAAKMLEPYVDGIDINCGCPQGIARRGNYGAFLLEKEEELLPLVKELVRELSIPVSVKVRLLPPPHVNHLGEADYRYDPFDVPQKSLELYTKLVDAGIHLLTIHGRTRHQKQQLTSNADWDTIRKAVDLLGHRIPIFANGSIETYQDVQACLEHTQADGVMSSESLLEYPPVFYHKPQYPIRTIGRVQLAKEYLALAKQYPPHLGGQASELKCIRVHTHRFLHADLQKDPVLRQGLVGANSMEAFEAAVNACAEYHIQKNLKVEEERLSWYLRHRDEADGGPPKPQPKAGYDQDEDEEEEPTCGIFSMDDSDY